MAFRRSGVRLPLAPPPDMCASNVLILLHNSQPDQAITTYVTTYACHPHPQRVVPWRHAAPVGIIRGRNRRSESSPGMPIGTRLYNALPILGIATGIFALAYAVLASFVALDTKVSAAWVIASCFVLLSLCCMLLDMLRAAISEGEIKLPRILTSLTGFQSVVSGPLLLVEPSRLLGHGTAVSIYTMHNGFEILIGEGVVQNVQQNGTVQVAVVNTVEKTETVWAGLYENKPDSLKASIVRPGNQYRGIAQ
jgi:hypothetical protein